MRGGRRDAAVTSSLQMTCVLRSKRSRLHRINFGPVSRGRWRWKPGSKRVIMDIMQSEFIFWNFITIFMSRDHTHHSQ